MNDILQGTTPHLIITVPETVPLVNATGIELTFQHNGKNHIVYADGVTIDTDENTITYVFTEAETLAMIPSKPLYWQLRIKNLDGIVGTLPETIRVHDLLSEVMIP